MKLKPEEQELSEEFVNHIETIVKAINRQKQNAHLDPWHAIDLEVFKAGESKGYKVSDIKLALNRLYKEKRLHFGKTVNHLWFVTNPNNNTKNESK